MNMKDYEKWFHEVFDEEGYSLPSWKVKIIKREPIINRYGQKTDYHKFTVYIYKPKCRKPLQCHYLNVNIVRKSFSLERSSFINF
jgi:hypothetical protein